MSKLWSKWFNSIQCETDWSKLETVKLEFNPVYGLRIIKTDIFTFLNFFVVILIFFNIHKYFVKSTEIYWDALDKKEIIIYNNNDYYY